MWPAFFGSLIFYIGIYKTFDLENVNWMSVVHSFSCLFILQFPEYIIPNSVAYYIVDTCQTSLWTWRIHHTIALILEGSALTGLIDISLCAEMLFYSEIGAVLYHISRIFKHSILVRIVFMTGYTYSRFELFRFIWNNIFQVPWIVKIGAFFIFAMNVWFIFTQIKTIVSRLCKKNEKIGLIQ